ncbi:fungal specific transcription factor factor domain-containing protein [Fusarium bulbicola]|nr:fungal specific transcription factor factor domain-containing protein [Fusarium bulbicola]
MLTGYEQTRHHLMICRQTTPHGSWKAQPAHLKWLCTARAAFYRKAKVTKVIGNVSSCKADRYSDLSDSSSVRSDSNHSTLRRLWWCCIIRDRILPLGLRRSIQITPDHFDLKKNMILGCIELEAEIGRSTLHCDDAKEGLSSIIKEVVKLSIVSTEVLLLAFPLKNTATNVDNSLTQLQDCDELWLGGTTRAPFAVLMEPPSQQAGQWFYTST